MENKRNRYKDYFKEIGKNKPLILKNKKCPKCNSNLGAIKPDKVWCINSSCNYGELHLNGNGVMNLEFQKTTQELAAEWFSSKTYLEQHAFSDKYFESKNPSLLTIEQVEEIWLKETNILQRQSARQKQMQLNVTNCGNKNCQNGVINGVTPKICKKCNPSNAKQFKEFNPELFQAYIDKFSDKDKYKALRILAESFGLNFEFNNSFTSMWNRTLE